MPFRTLAAGIAVVVALGLSAAPSRAVEFIDAAARHVIVPDRVGRVMPDSPAAAVLVFAVAPDKLIGWPEPLTRGQRAYIPRKYARLPVVGSLAGSDPTAAEPALARLRPALIVGFGAVTSQRVALADQIQQQTGIPYVMMGGAIQRTPEVLRKLGGLLGVGDRGEDLAVYAEHAIGSMRGRLLIESPVGRPRIYYGKGPDGLTTGFAEGAAISDIEQAGAINVAAGLGEGGVGRVTPTQLLAWNPSIVIAELRPFSDDLKRRREWRSLAAVHDRRVYHAPLEPFGWIDDPPGINRLIGLYWLSAVLYPASYQEDLRADVRDFYEKFWGAKLTDQQVDALVKSAEAKPGEFDLTSGAGPLLGPGPVPPLTTPSGPGPNVPGRVAPPGRGGLPNQLGNPLGTKP
jgi:iron complex transport system substrate-binding protein